MKVTEFKKTLEHMNMQQLQEKLDSLRHELFGLRLTVATAHVKDHAQFKQLRKNIARVLTRVQQNNLNSASK
jgi:ribosomal protein L29